MSHGQKVIVAGTGISGIAATRLLLDMGGEVVLYDGNANQNREKVLAAFEDKSRVTLVLGELKRTDLVGVELCIVSPGVPMDSPFAATIIDAKIPIWGEIQLAYHCAKGRLAAITGTNGKTTTTALTGEIMKAFYESVFIVGNIGIPYTQVALDTEDTSVTVAEISSFQLETIMDFRPNVSAILNITSDHLNRHKTMENYIEIKKGITLNQTGSDSVVLNYDDPVLREFGQDEEQKPKARVLFFSSREKLKEGFYLDRDNIMYSHNGRETLLINVHDMNLLGRHNYENVMAAAAVSLEMGVPMETIRRVIRRFQAVDSTALNLSP